MKIILACIIALLFSVPVFAEDNAVFTRDMIMKHSSSMNTGTFSKRTESYVPEKMETLGVTAIAGLILGSLFAEEPTAAFIRYSGATNVRTHYWFLGQKKDCKGVGGGSPFACTTWDNASRISKGELATANISTDIFKTLFAENLRQATRGYEGTNYALAVNTVAVVTTLEVCAHAASFMNVGFFTPDEAASVKNAWGKKAEIGYYVGTGIACAFEMFEHGKYIILNISGKDYDVTMYPWEKIGIQVGPFATPTGDIGYGLEWRHYF